MESISADVNPSDVPSTRGLPQSSFQVLEAMLFASILDEHRDQLLERLRGLCDPNYSSFDEHEMVLALKTTDSPSVVLHLRRKFNAANVNPDVWHCRYVGAPLADKAPAICRSATDSVIHCTAMMDFVKNMGLRLEYEYVARGFLFTKGPIKIIVSKIFLPNMPGQYDREGLKPQTESNIIEAIIPVKNEETAKYAKILKDFCDQLAPLVEFKKVEYFKPKG